ncbi:MAG: hypothetical protein WC309_04725 [Candidatus Paceibacterota bacterium]|jgi:hypothetical protein
MAKKEYSFEIIKAYPKKRQFIIIKQTNSFLRQLEKSIFGG